MSKVLVITLLTLFVVTIASAQKSNIWRGGAPGHETDWSYFKNWSSGSVPSEFDCVVIPNVSTSTSDYPVIHKGEIEVWSLEIQSGAMLTLLPKARLLADEVDIQGTCKGCDRRLLLDGSEDATAFFRKK
jgi:hypothetical protein